MTRKEKFGGVTVTHKPFLVLLIIGIAAPHKRGEKIHVPTCTQCHSEERHTIVGIISRLAADS